MEDQNKQETKAAADADATKQFDTRVESVINAFNINTDNSSITDAMPIGRALKSKKSSRDPAPTLQSKSPEDTAKKMPQLTQVAFTIPTEGTTPVPPEKREGSPERRVYPPTPYLDRRQLPPRKPKQEDTNNNLCIHGTSPTSPTSMFMEQPPSTRSKTPATQNEVEYRFSTSPKKASTYSACDNLKRTSPILGSNVKTKPKSGVEQMNYINVARSYNIESESIGDVAQSSAKKKVADGQNAADLKNDANYSNNHFHQLSAELASKVITAIDDEMIVGKAEVKDASNYDISTLFCNKDTEANTKISPRVMNTVPYGSASAERYNSPEHTGYASASDSLINQWGEPYDFNCDFDLAGKQPISFHDESESESSLSTVKAGSSSSETDRKLLETYDAEMGLAQWLQDCFLSSPLVLPYKAEQTSPPLSPFGAVRRTNDGSGTSPTGEMNDYPKVSSNEPDVYDQLEQQPPLKVSRGWNTKDGIAQDKTSNETNSLLVEQTGSNLQTNWSYSPVTLPRDTVWEYKYTERQKSSPQTSEWPRWRSQETGERIKNASTPDVSHIQCSPKEFSEEKEDLRDFFTGVKSPVPKKRMSHFAHTGHYLYHLYKHGKLADVHIRSQDRLFTTHSMVLAAHSDYLACLLLHEGRPIYNLQLNSISITALSILLEYMYTGELSINEDTVVEVLSGAIALQMHSECDTCRDFIKHLNPSQLLKVWIQTLEYKCLSEDAANLLQASARNFRTVTKLEDFLQLPLERVLELLSRDDLNIHSELDVARAGMHWVRHDWHNKQQYISAIMNTVRLPHMTLKEVHCLANETPDLMKSESKEDLLSACWFLSSKQEQLPHQLGDIKIPAHRVKIKSESLQHSKIAPYEAGMESLREAFSPTTRDFSPPQNFGDGASTAPLSEELAKICDGELGESVSDTPEEDDSPDIDKNANNTNNSLTSNAENVIHCSTNILEPDIDKHDDWAAKADIPFTGEYYPSLQSYLAEKDCPSLVLVGGYDPCEEQDFLSGLKILCMTEDGGSFSLQGLMPRRRVHHTTEYLAQTIYIIGGLDPSVAAEGLVRPLASVFTYDLMTAVWEEISALCTTRSHHGSCVLGDSIYVVGGQDEGESVLSSVERYDATSKEWTAVASMPQGRRGPSVVALDGRILVIGGCDEGDHAQGDHGHFIIQNTVLSYDPETDSWTEICNTPLDRSWLSAAASVYNDVVWLSGGVTPSSSFLTLCRSQDIVESFNPSSKSWTPAEKPLNVARHHATSAVVNGCLYVIGGLSTVENAAVRDVDIYDIDNKCWLEAIQLPQKVMGACAVVVPPIKMKPWKC